MSEQQKPDIIHDRRTDTLGQLINKPVDLHLQYNGLFQAYQVISITSTVIYRPGEWLSPNVVDQCCLQKGWSVTMVHDDFLKSILGSIIQLPKLAIPAL